MNVDREIIFTAAEVDAHSFYKQGVYRFFNGSKGNVPPEGVTPYSDLLKKKLSEALQAISDGEHITFKISDGYKVTQGGRKLSCYVTCSHKIRQTVYYTAEHHQPGMALRQVWKVKCEQCAHPVPSSVKAPAVQPAPSPPAFAQHANSLRQAAANAINLFIAGTGQDVSTMLNRRTECINTASNALLAAFATIENAHVAVEVPPDVFASQDNDADAAVDLRRSRSLPTLRSSLRRSRSLSSFTSLGRSSK
jgi:hypothetical protein